MRDTTVDKSKDRRRKGGTWIEFREFKEQVDFLTVLQHYGAEGNVRGDRFQCRCPLPTHQGQRRSPSFSANLTKKIFQCFSCGAKGDLIAFVAIAEGLDPQRGDDLRKAALLIKEKFGGPNNHQAKAMQAEPKPKPVAQNNTGQVWNTRPAIVNAPLDFRLQGLDSEHPYLKERGFTPKTIAHFGLGYCARGLMQGRIAIPLHDRRGRLVGYAGRLVDETKIGPAAPKYLFPGAREREGKVHRFHKSLFLYHGFHLTAPVSDLIVVEGFASVWWLWQCGFPDVAALMGASCGDRQAALIVRAVKPGGRVWLMPDGDEAGKRCAESVMVKVASHRSVRWVRLKEDQQPTNFKPHDLRALVKFDP